MRWTLILILGLACAGTVMALAGPRQDAGPALPPVPDTSYGLGFMLGDETRGELARDGMGVDLALVADGFADGLREARPQVSRDEMEGILQSVHEELQRRMVDRLLKENPEFKALHDRNLERSRRFHDLFGAQEGVVTQDNGLQYKVLVAGRGRLAGRRGTVLVNVEIQTLDRTVLHDGSEPIEVQIDTISRGGAELLRAMREGSKWQFAIPPSLAYGPGGRYPDIGPNQTLVGTVEMLEIR
jgi:FKBP-type peptidyl-prolyl cis-trans isomerase